MSKEIQAMVERVLLLDFISQDFLNVRKDAMKAGGPAIAQMVEQFTVAALLTKWCSRFTQ